MSSEPDWIQVKIVTSCIRSLDGSPSSCEEHRNADAERRDHRRAADDVADPVQQPATDQQHDRPGQRQGDEQHRRPVDTRHWINSFIMAPGPVRT